MKKLNEYADMSLIELITIQFDFAIEDQLIQDYIDDYREHVLALQRANSAEKRDLSLLYVLDSLESLVNYALKEVFGSEPSSSIINQLRKIEFALSVFVEKCALSDKQEEKAKSVLCSLHDVLSDQHNNSDSSSCKQNDTKEVNSIKNTVFSEVSSYQQDALIVSKNKSLSLSGFIAEIRSLQGDLYSAHVYCFCNQLMQDKNRDEILSNFFSEYGVKKSSAKLLAIIHPDKHESSILSQAQLKVLATATMFVLSVRAISDECLQDELQDEFDDLVDLSKKFDVFSDKLTDFSIITNVELYYYSILSNFGCKLSKAWCDSLITLYYNVFVYIVHWCKDRNIVWLNGNLRVFKCHVIELSRYYVDKPKIKGLFDNFLKIDQTKMAVTDSAMLLENNGASKSQNVSWFSYLRSALFSGISVTLFASTAGVSWPAIVAYGIVRTILSGTKILSGVMYHRACSDRDEYYEKLLCDIKYDYQQTHQRVDKQLGMILRREKMLQNDREVGAILISSMRENHKKLANKHDHSIADAELLKSLECEIQNASTSLELTTYFESISSSTQLDDGSNDDLWKELLAIEGFSQEEYEDLRESVATIDKPVAAREFLEDVLKVKLRRNELA